MKLETLAKTALFGLVLALAVVLTSWFTSERSPAYADVSQGGGWIMVSSQLAVGDGMIYLFNTEKEVLLVYAFYRRQGGGGTSRFRGGLEFIAGRHCKWDTLFSQQLPYPLRSGSSDTHTPAQMKALFDKASNQR